jgi:uncharacterized membrane protein
MARLKGLSDSVVAFALTLLVLDIRVPPGITPADLPGSVVGLGPELLIYLISFAIIGGAWGSHQRMLGQIGRGDGLLVWFNLLSLLPVILLPACASLLGDFPEQTAATAVFGSDALAIQLTAFGLWRHASRQALINPALEPRIVVVIGRRLLVNALGFGLSIPVALISPAIAYALWVAVFALVFTTDWLSWQQSRKTTQEAIAIDGATEARVLIRHTSGKLHLDAVDGEAVLVGGVFGGGVERSVRHDGARSEVDLVVPRRSDLLDPRYPWAWGQFSTDWDLGLSRRIPISLTVDTVGGVADLELGDLGLTDLDVRADGSAVEIGLPAAAGRTTVAVESKAAAVIVRIPDGVAAWIRGDNDGTALDVDVARFPVVVEGGGYRSANYAESRNRADVSVTLVDGSVTVV